MPLTHGTKWIYFVYVNETRLSQNWSREDLSGYQVKSPTFCFDHSLALLDARLIWESEYDLRAIV